MIDLLSYGSCESFNCVYILFCEIFGKYNFGETNNFRRRLFAHLSNIRRFHKFLNITSEVAYHFNLPENNILNMKWLIFKTNLSDTLTRRSIEQDLLFT